MKVMKVEELVMFRKYRGLIIFEIHLAADMVSMRLLVGYQMLWNTVGVVST